MITLITQSRFEDAGGNIYRAIGHDGLQRSDYVGIIQDDGSINWLKSRIVGKSQLPISELIKFVSQK